MPLDKAQVVGRYPGQLLTILTMPGTDMLGRLGRAVRPPHIEQANDSGTDKLLEERDRLWRENMKLMHDLNEARQTIVQLGQLKHRVDLKGVDFVDALVTAWPAMKTNPTLTVNRGERDGVRKNNVVASGFNLVGQVVDVSPTYSTVRLITAPGSSFNLRIIPPVPGQTERELLVIGKAANNFREFWAVAGTNDPVQPGDLAVLYDDTWPREARGFVVGKVRGIVPLPEEPLLRRRIVIEPLKPLESLDRVIVVVPQEAGH